MSVSNLVVLAAAAGLIVVVAFVLVSVTRSRRTLTRRMAALATRMGDEDLGLEGTGIEGQMAHLERLIDAAVSASGEASVARTRAEMALGGLPIGVLVADDQGEIVYRNARAASLLHGEIEGSPAHGVVEEMLISAAEGRSLKKRFEVSGPRPRTLDVLATPLEDQFRNIGGLAVIDDVSDEERVETARRAFVADLGQELRVPVGALGLLAETVAAETDPVLVQRLARRLQSESQRLGRVIDDLVSLAAIGGDDSVAREPVPVHLFVAQAAERVRPGAQDKRITINFSEHPRRLAVLGDRRQLVSATFHLLDNAVKYSSEGSVVEVRARLDGDHVELSVRDRGIGIPARDLDRIFDRFWRGDRSRSLGREAGSGLGLAVVRHVAMNHQGGVRVESKEGEGSTFVMRLISAPAPVSNAPALAPLEATG